MICSLGLLVSKDISRLAWHMVMLSIFFLGCWLSGGGCKFVAAIIFGSISMVLGGVDAAGVAGRGDAIDWGLQERQASQNHGGGRQPTWNCCVQKWWLSPVLLRLGILVCHVAVLLEPMLRYRSRRAPFISYEGK